MRRLHARYDNLVWMKLSEISRYWAARELTAIERQPNGIALNAPFAAPDFTLELPGSVHGVTLKAAGERQPLREVSRMLDLTAGSWLSQGDRVIACFDLPRGASTLNLAAE